MILIIDEIGITKDAKYVGTKSLLDNLTVSLQKMVAHVQLVLVGTGLDAITSSENSNQDAIKMLLGHWAKYCGWSVHLTMCIRHRSHRRFEKLPFSSNWVRMRGEARAAWFLVATVKKYGDYTRRMLL
jgi:hypothetical protein